MSIIGSSASPAVRTLAARTKTETEAIYQSATRRAKGEAALDSIATLADASPNERIVAATMRAATRGFSDSTAATAQGIALATLASGVGGSVGPALAGLANQVLDNIYSSSDRRVVSSTFLDAIKSHGAPAEQQHADAVLRAVPSTISDSNAATVNRLALDQIANGVPSSPAQALTGFLREVHGAIYSGADRRVIGASIFGTLAASSPVAQTVQAMAAQQVSDSTAVTVHAQAADLVAKQSGKPVEQQLAGLGLGVRDAIYSSADKTLVAQPILAAIAAGAQPQAAAVAGATQAASTLGVSPSTLVALQTKALEQVARPTRDGVEVTLARLGTAAADEIYSRDDKRTLARHLLTEIQQRSSDRNVTRTLDWVAGAPGQGDPDAALGLLQSIQAGRCEIPDCTFTIGKETLTVAIPDLDESQEPSARRAGLESTVAQNRAVLRRLDAVIDEGGAAIQPLAARQQQLLAGVMNPTTAAPPAAPRKDITRKLVKIGEVAMFGGAAACLLGAGAAGLAVMAGGIVTVIASVFVGLRSDARGPRGGRADLYDELSKVGEEISRLQERMASARRVADNAQRAVALAEGPLDVLRMADAVNQPVVDRTLTVEDTELVIGGIRVPRRAPAESQS